MDKDTISFRTDTKMKHALDSIAGQLDRDRSYVLNEAIRHYLELYGWQTERIKAGLADANNGRFTAPGDVKAFFKKHGA